MNPTPLIFLDGQKQSCELCLIDDVRNPIRGQISPKFNIKRDVIQLKTFLFNHVTFEEILPSAVKSKFGQRYSLSWV